MDHRAGEGENEKHEQASLDNLGNEVHGYVVRDIWQRSRLPRTVLEEIWELVDERRVGRLTREQFVVGMWLVDQSLKGKKVPVRVNQSVWDSVRGFKSGP